MILQAWVDEKYDPKKAKVSLLDETRILVVTRGSKEHLDLSEERTGRRRLEYTAKKQESFEKIAKKYGLDARDLARINRRPHTTVLEKGETCIVYEVVDRTRSERAEEQWKATPKANRAKKTEKKQEAKKSEEKKEEKREEKKEEPGTGTGTGTGTGSEGPVSSPDDVD